MRGMTRAACTVLLIATGAYSHASAAEKVFEANWLLAEAEIRTAGSSAKVEMTPPLLKTFREAAETQRPSFDDVYRRVAAKDRVARLSNYLRVLRALEGGTAEAAGFHWAYLLSDVTYSAVTFSGESPARLVGFEAAGRSYIYQPGTRRLRRAGSLVLPRVAPDDSAYDAPVSLYFEAEKSKAVWTGRPYGKELFLPAMQTTLGCQINVASKPAGAAVLFNGKPWPRPTNTNVIQEPGEWEVTVRLAGYKDWSDRRALGPGELWVIEAPLEQRP